MRDELRCGNLEAALADMDDELTPGKLRGESPQHALRRLGAEAPDIGSADLYAIRDLVAGAREGKSDAQKDKEKRNNPAGGSLSGPFGPMPLPPHTPVPRNTH